ncbi:MAG: DUF4230 domain-containing protein [Clostridiaceae bacterium]|nr:DUF4230 domain-containing protein [Clostridiaceae bacterium]
MGKKSSFKFILIGVVFLAIASVIFSIPRLYGRANKAEVITISTLKKIINISELSTFQAVYNGIAEVMNENKPDKLDYYVTYNAKVKAGFDLEQVDIDFDEKLKKITITIPEIKITDVVVDIATLDYIFLNDKANKSSVSEQAYKACIEDAKKESAEESAIYELAKQNAQNIMKALINPLIEQLDSDYVLEIK